MTEQNQSSAGNEGNQNQTNQTSSASEQTNNQDSSTDTEPRIPKYRFDEVNRRAREAEATLRKLEKEREEAEEAKANEKGEFQKIADKWKSKAEKLQAELEQERSARKRERRLNVWNEAAQGIVRGEAVSDAFSFLSEAELDSIDDNDPEQYKPLAQALVESKPYLGADGPRGAGSGGSSAPVRTFAGNGSQTRDRSSIFASKQKRRQWK